MGEHQHGLYAMPSLVDKQTLTISPSNNGPLLLEGPKNSVAAEPERENYSRGGKFDIPGIDATTAKQVLLLGYYKVPDSSTVKLAPTVNKLQITASSLSDREKPRGDKPSTLHPGDSYLPLGYPFVVPDGFYGQEEPRKDYNSTLIDVGIEALKGFKLSFVFSVEFVRFCLELVPWSKASFKELENKELKAIVVLMVVLIITLIQLVKSGVSFFYIFHYSTCFLREER